MNKLIFVAFLAFAASVGAKSLKFASEKEHIAHTDYRLLLDAVLHGRHGYSDLKTTQHLLGKFSFTNCGSPDKETVVVSNLDVKPDPIKLPGNLTITASGQIKKSFGKPLTAALTIHKKILGIWVEVPCIDNIGSCTYDNACDKISSVLKQCPPFLVKQGINCTCPFPATKIITVKDQSFPLDVTIPSVANGDVKVMVKVTSGSTDITCVEVTATLG